MLLRMLASGFIISSLIWAAALAIMIDRKLGDASVYFAVAGILTLFGVVHSPMAGEKMFLPWSTSLSESGHFMLVIQFAVGYLVMAGVLFGLGVAMKDSLKPIETDEEFEALSEH